MLVLAAVTVTLAPLAERVPLPLPLVPTVTLPTLSVEGLALNWPTAAVPVPESEMVSVGLEAFEPMVTLPLALPAEPGVKVTENVVLCPEVSVSGVLIPLRLKPVPLAVA